jgi:hypothetical protein
MTYRHTPGPWHLSDETNPLIYSDANRGTYVAQVFAYTDGTTGTSRPQADADARLIAAAPELLAVLVGIERSMGWLVDNPDEPLIMSRSDFDAVRAAIRNATGE